ncbi:MAG: hypothetical protein O3A63_03805 [Proteobacteria bacterium]|nr:hypothetical protein [Pseudomonadota bacterium]
MEGRQAEKHSALALVAVNDDEEASGVPSEASLQAELNKWRERVPRLAAALREKTEEMETLKSRYIELTEARPPAADGRLTDLEAELAESSARIDLKIAEIAQRDDAIRLLQNEHDAWKVKCERVSRLLDGQSTEMLTQRSLAEEANERRIAVEAQLAQAVRSEQTARAQTDSLTNRNAQLKETTDMANQQIHMLGEDLAHLKAQLANHNSAEVDELRAEVERLTQQEKMLRSVLSETEQNLLVLQQHDHDTKEQTRQVRAELERAVQETHHVQHQVAVVNADLQAKTEAWHSERNDLTDQNLELEQMSAAEKKALLHQIAEQGDLYERQEHKFRVLSTKFIRLHEELKGLTDERQTLTREVARLGFDDNERTQAINKAVDEARARFETEFAQQLELADLQQQKVSELLSTVQARDAEISRLESCVTQAQEANHQREHERAALSGQLTQTRSRLAKIESHLDDSGELISKLEKDNQELKSRLADAREAPAPAFQAEGLNRPPVNAVDDFTKIRGIGPKLAIQLHHQGVLCYDDIARLDQAALELESHLLHAFRSRIIRDSWISQARALSEAKTR